MTRRLPARNRRPGPARAHGYARELVLPTVLLLAALGLAAFAGRGEDSAVYQLLPAREVDTLVIGDIFFEEAAPGQLIEQGDTLGWLIAPAEREALDALRRPEMLSLDQLQHYLHKVAHLLPEDMRQPTFFQGKAATPAVDVGRMREQVDQRERAALALQSAYLKTTDPAERDLLRTQLQAAERALSRARRHRDRSIRQLEDDPSDKPIMLPPSAKHWLDALLEQAPVRAMAAGTYIGYEPNAAAGTLWLERDVPLTWSLSPCPDLPAPASKERVVLQQVGGDVEITASWVDVDRCRVATSGPIADTLHGQAFRMAGGGGRPVLLYLLSWRAVGGS